MQIVENDSWTHSTEAESFIRELAKTPLLTFDQERALTQAIAKGYADLEIKDLQLEDVHSDLERSILENERLCIKEELDQHVYNMFSSNFRMVISQARKPGRMEYPDRISWGGIGLLRAIRKFDPTRNDPATGSPIRFSTYAVPWIIQFIQRSGEQLDDLIRIPVHMRGVIKRLRRQHLIFAQAHGRFPSLEELCSFTGEDITRIRQVFAVSETPLSIHMLYGEDNHTLEDVIPDPGISIEEDYLDKEYRETIQLSVTDMLKAMESDKNAQIRRYARVLKLRYRIGEVVQMNDTPERTLEEVGKLMRDHRKPNGITRERARQIYRNAVRYIKEQYPTIQVVLDN